MSARWPRGPELQETVSLLRRFFCSHAFIERGTFKRGGKWWATLVCGKCAAVKREPLIK